MQPICCRVWLLSSFALLAVLYFHSHSCDLLAVAIVHFLPRSLLRFPSVLVAGSRFDTFLFQRVILRTYFNTLKLLTSTFSSSLKGVLFCRFRGFGGSYSVLV